MDVTRRDFLYCAAVTATAAALTPRRRGGRAPLGAGCALLDLGAHCTLRESLVGYQAALAGSEIVAGSMLIVPAALVIGGAAARRIVRHIEDGGTLILESGAIFAEPADSEFRAHRDALRDLLGVDVDPPRRLARERTRVPYAEFHWPSPTLVRDYSAIVPVDAHGDERIACVGDTTVALARRRGRGLIIFLGSPIGPALWAGDAEARRWLHEAFRRSECDASPGSPSLNGPDCRGITG